MLTPDMIYVMTSRRRVRGEVVLVENEVVVNSFEEDAERYYFTYSFINPAEGNWGSGSIYKNGIRKFGIIKMIGTGRTHYRPRFASVTPAHGPSYSCM